MHVIRARNPQQAAVEVSCLLGREGLINAADNIVVDEPVTTVYMKTAEIALCQGSTFPARHFLDGLVELSSHANQLEVMVSNLRAHNQAVLPIHRSKMRMFRVNRFGEIEQTVIRESSSAITSYGPDVVADSLIQQFVAAAAGGSVGRLWQTSMRYFEKSGYSVRETDDPYRLGLVRPYPLVSIDAGQWLAELQMFVDEGDRAIGFTEPFFRRVALPLLRAQRVIEDKTEKNRLAAAAEHVSRCVASDWVVACLAWINREVKIGLASEKPAT